MILVGWIILCWMQVEITIRMEIYWWGWGNNAEGRELMFLLVLTTACFAISENDMEGTTSSDRRVCDTA